MALWIFFLNEDSNILPMIFHSQPQVEHKLGKKDLLNRIISLSMRQTFFFKYPTLHIPKRNLFLGLKQSKKLINKRWEPLDTTVSCMYQWL